ncbi:MAG TPA: hypothetical protein VGN95_02410 [Pyrinomonadaceae bacterium]|jgi:hypothetical protein|nr:hypothetical protein [Pyrinomonadaceae bacterium]
MALKLKTHGKDLMKDIFLLKENPFRASEIFSVDRRSTYVPQIYGEQFNEFYKKFFLIPLSREENKQVIGAVWSTHTGDSRGKGYGKSFLMHRESVEINADFGASKLHEFGIDESDSKENPFLAGYCTFDQAKEVKSFPAALLDAVAFILESEHGDGNVHLALRNRIIAKTGAAEGFESEAIMRVLQKELRKFRSLNIQLNHATVERFIQKLCYEDTDDLVNSIRHTIGPRIKVAQGFNFIHIFNVFLLTAGIKYVVYFVDQIENFARFARNQERDLKILRESMCQTSPTDGMASFVFQMHVHALAEIADWWDSVEHLPSLDPKKLINSTRIVDLQGLKHRQDAEILAARYLENNRVDGVKVPNRLHPFDQDIVEAVRQSVNNNPRRFLEKLGAILDNAIVNERKKIDLSFVTPLLEDDEEGISFTDDLEDEYANLER